MSDLAISLDLNTLDIIKVLIMRFSPLACHILPRISKCSSRPVAQHPSICSTPYMSETQPHPDTEHRIKVYKLF
jgi:hypothetical protein